MTLSIMGLVMTLRINYTQHNDTQHNDTQHNDTQHNDIQHKDPQHNETSYNTQHEWHWAWTFSITVLSAIMLSVAITCYAECHHAECRYAECRNACSKTMVQSFLPIQLSVRIMVGESAFDQKLLHQAPKLFSPNSFCFSRKFFWLWPVL